MASFQLGNIRVIPVGSGASYQIGNIRFVDTAAGGTGVVEADASSTGAATVSGVSGSINKTDATSAGVATASADAQAIVNSVASSDGTSTASADTQAVIAAIASSDGIAAASADSQATIASVASSDGTSTASADTQATAASIASSDGTSTASADTQTVVPSVASSGGTSTASADAENAGTGPSIVEADANSAGVAVASAVSGSLAQVVAVSAGLGEALGIAAGIYLSTADSVGAATASGISAVLAPATADSSGTASASALTAVILATTATSSGVSTTSGVSGAQVLAQAISSGTSTALADAENVGSGPAVVEADANASGVATAVGVSGAQVFSQASSAGTSTASADASDANAVALTATASVVQAGIGSSRVYYTTVEDTTYWANAITSGKVTSAGVASEWGVTRPPRQPDVAALTTGGLHAGSYRVAITWIGSDGLESGAGPSVRVEVPVGGGIHLTNFPAPPSYATGVAVYVSSVNSKDLYLYGEYTPSVNDAVISYKECTIPLQTQFMFPPIPRAEVLAHYGRIYYVVGKRLYFTLPTKYGLQRKNSFWAFDSDIQVIASTPKVLFVGTRTRITKITEIDGEGPPIFEVVKDYGAVRNSVAYDPNGVAAYFMTSHGLVMVSPEGVEELTYKDVAIPFFTSGNTTVTERDGVKLLTFIGQGGTQNPLADDEYNTSELARGSL